MSIIVDGGAKRDLLVELLQNTDISRAIVFTRTKRGADRVAQHLEHARSARRRSTATRARASACAR